MSDNIKEPSLWLGEPNVALRLALGKLAEEAGELAAAASRAAIHGIAELNPDTKEPNLVALWKEMADAEALIATVNGQLFMHGHTVDSAKYSKRVLDKGWQKNKWLMAVWHHLNDKKSSVDNA